MAGKLKGSAIVDASVTEVQLAANIVATLAQAANAYNQANAATGLAQTAYNQATLAYTAANNSGNTVAVSSNTGTLFGKQLNFTNSQTITVSIADEGPNANIVINSISTDINTLAEIYGQANAAYTQANVALNASSNNNAKITLINSTLDALNVNIMLAHTDANNAYNIGNLAYVIATAADSQADQAYNHANVAYDRSLNTEILISSTLYPYVNTVYAQANAAYNQANNAVNVAILAGNTVAVSQNTIFTLTGKKLNFVNTANIGITLTDAGNGIANIVITGSSGNYVRLANDTTTNTTAYLVFTSNTSGNLLNANVSTSKLTFNPNTGILSATTFNSLSDIKYKENVETLLNAIEILSQIRGVRFNWKESGAPSMGVIAQELANVVPEIVNTEPAGGVMTVNYSGMNAILIEAMKSMYSELRELRAEIEKLKDVSSVK
jgi:hypothetical protein